jgi:general secretion pathway protein D
MKHYFRGFANGVVLWCLAAVFSFSHALAGTISVQPASLPVVGATTISLDITIAGAADLFGFQFDIGFDPSVLSASSVTEGPFLGTGGATFFIPGFVDNLAGTVSFTADTLLTALSGVNGSGVLASLHFNSIGNGTSAITLFNVTALDSSLSGVVETIQNGSVNVSGVSAGTPEPGGFLLVGAGLVVLCGGVRLRRRGAVGRRSLWSSIS